MSSAHHPKVRIRHDNLEPPRDHGRSASLSGVLAITLAGVAVLSAPVPLFIPYLGFLPACIAAAGAVIAGIGLRGSTRGTGMAAAGLIVSAVVFALLAGVATMWNVVVTDPAIRDYDELHEVIEYVKQLVFG